MAQILAVPFFLQFSLNEETPNEKGKQGTTWVPRFNMLPFKQAERTCLMVVDRVRVRSMYITLSRGVFENYE